MASQASLHADLRAVGVVLERVDGNVRGLAEGMVSMREELSAKIDDLERRLSERISVLESAVREHAAELRTLRAAVEGLRRDLEQRPDRAELSSHASSGWRFCGSRSRVHLLRRATDGNAPLPGKAAQPGLNAEPHDTSNAP